MTEKFDSEFHRRYVGWEGESEIEERRDLDRKRVDISGISVEEILAEYRRYVNDPEAELPEAIVEELRLIGKIKAE